MSRENVEVVRVSLARWNAEDMEALRETYDPGVIVRPPEGWPEPGPFVGRDAVMRQWEQLRQTFDDEALELLSDFIDAGERVAVRVCWRGAGHGPEANLEMTDVFTVRKRRIFYLECFWDHAEALECLGLSAQDSHAESGREMTEESTPDLADLLRRLVDIVNRRAWGELADVFARDGVLDLSDLGLGAYEGDAIPAFGEDWVGAYDKYEMVMDEVLELDNGVIFTVNTQVARPTGSSGDVRLHDAYVFICEDNRILRWTAYQSIDEARAVAERLAQERG